MTIHINRTTRFDIPKIVKCFKEELLHGGTIILNKELNSHLKGNAEEVAKSLATESWNQLGNVHGKFRSIYVRNSGLNPDLLVIEVKFKIFKKPSPTKDITTWELTEDEKDLYRPEEQEQQYCPSCGSTQGDCERGGLYCH